MNGTRFNPNLGSKNPKDPVSSLLEMHHMSHKCSNPPQPRVYRNSSRDICGNSRDICGNSRIKSMNIETLDTIVESSDISFANSKLRLNSDKSCPEKKWFLERIKEQIECVRAKIKEYKDGFVRSFKNLFRSICSLIRTDKKDINRY